MNAGNKISRGFTLIELLVAIAVVVVLATVAVPNFQSLIAQNRLEADYYQVLGGLRYARTEALKRREPVTAIITPDDDGAGWRLEVKLDDGTNLGAIDCTSTADANCLMVRDHDDSLPALSITNSSVTYNALGRLTAGASIQMDITHDSDTQQVCVEISGNVVGRSCA
ncbi:GspH/FimT family pseudopilin [Halomonas maura]|uniref:GspH/FimT family pseudopilin n=1 Tax=Halomonas maura TaxID=117606 RepID=UPI0025B527F7|nr:GspH/FimT family pseudopilin [Halomonas maura]MDN3557132.1 GspH/FimT family pseudopilin [Halomonas maura]